MPSKPSRRLKPLKDSRGSRARAPPQRHTSQQHMHTFKRAKPEQTTSTPTTPKQKRTPRMHGRSAAPSGETTGGEPSLRTAPRPL